MKFIKNLFNPSVEVLVGKELERCQVALLQAYGTLESWQAQVTMLEAKIKRLDIQKQAFAAASGLVGEFELKVAVEEPTLLREAKQGFQRASKITEPVTKLQAKKPAKAPDQTV